MNETSRHQKVAQLVQQAYESSTDYFAQWVWENHVPVVAQKTEDLSKKYGANADIAVAGAWLHDFGDAFVHRHADEHEEVTRNEATRVLKKTGYSKEEIKEVLEEVIAPHSCRDGFLPTTLEGKVMATADALAHFETDFYVQFSWKHLPENKTYDEFLEWVAKKLERDFNDKIFFDEVREKVKNRYEALKNVFAA